MALASFLFLGVPIDAVAGPREDFEKLEIDMEIATEDYFSGMSEMVGEDGKAKVGAKVPVDRRPALLRKMDKIATKAKGTSDEGYLLAQTLSWALNVDSATALDRFRKLVKSNPNEPSIEDILEQLPYTITDKKLLSPWAGALVELADAASQKQSKEIAFFTAGLLALESADLDKARTCFSKVLRLNGRKQTTKTATVPPESREDDPDKVALAGAYLYEIDHLQIGMAAPDLVVKKLNGEMFTLRSFRGKTVLLNFWATW